VGLEADCRGTFEGVSSRGKALLETTELVFRAGARRVRVPLADVTAVTVASGTLTLVWRGGPLALELGAAAERWAEKIEHPPGRLEKLGVKPGARVALVGRFELDPTFAAEIDARGVTLAAKGPVDLLFYAAVAPPDLERLPALAKRLQPDGALWLVRPKGKDTPVTEAAARAAGLAAGLVDVKVAAFSATHTAEKFVIPHAKRR
jgi:hypothetical protein